MFSNEQNNAKMHSLECILALFTGLLLQSVRKGDVFNCSAGLYSHPTRVKSKRADILRRLMMA